MNKLLFCLATLLIANSHLEALYPYPWLAGDGLLGNTLFFLLSGYGLVLSDRRGRRPFADWYRRRVLRIYPALWLTVIVFEIGLAGHWRDWTWRDYLIALAWPTAYGFIAHIMVFYVAFYWLLALDGTRRLGLWAAGAAAVYAATYAVAWRNDPAAFDGSLGMLPDAVYAAYFFGAMLLGGLAARDETDHQPSGAAAAAVVLLIAAVYLGVKLAMVQGRIEKHFFVLHVLVAGLCWALFRMVRAPFAREGSALDRTIGPAVAFVGGLSLEIYLVHEYVHRDERVRALAFPLNVAVFFAVSLLAAFIIARVCRLLGAQPTARAGV